MGSTDGINENCKPSSGAAVKISLLFLFVKALTLGPQPSKILHTISLSLLPTPKLPALLSAICSLWMDVEHTVLWGVGNQAPQNTAARCSEMSI